MRINMSKKIVAAAALAGLSIGFGGVAAFADPIADVHAGVDVEATVDAVINLPGGGGGGGPLPGPVGPLAALILSCAFENTPPVSLFGLFTDDDDLLCADAADIDVLGSEPIDIHLNPTGDDHPFSILGEDVISDDFSILGGTAGPLNFVDDGVLRFLLNGADDALTGRL